MSLITKLESSITDTSLLKLGEVRFKVRVPSGLSSAQNRVDFRNTDLTKGVYTIGGTFSDGSTRKNFSGTGYATEFHLGAGEYDFVLEDKYGLVGNPATNAIPINTALASSLMDICLDSGNFKFCENVEKVNVTNLLGPNFVELDFKKFFDIQKIKSFACTGVASEKMKADTVIIDISELPDDVAIINIQNQKYVTGDMSDFSARSKITTFVARLTSVVGSIENLSNCVGITRLNVGMCKYINGSLNALFDSLHENGKVSGTLNVLYGGNGSGVTYNGQTSVNEAIFNVTFTSEGWTVA